MQNRGFFPIVMDVKYQIENCLSVDEFQQVLVDSSLGERRPVENKNSLDNMLKHANLILTARVENKLVGVARSFTDYSFCTYLSDLAVSIKWQKKGIGKELIKRTLKAAPNTKVILLAAPAAEKYYPKIGMTRHTHAFLLADENQLI